MLAANLHIRLDYIDYDYLVHRTLVHNGVDIIYAYVCVSYVYNIYFFEVCSMHVLVGGVVPHRSRSLQLQAIILLSNPVQFTLMPYPTACPSFA